MADEKKSVDTTASGDLERTQHTRASSRSLKHAHDGDEALKALPQLGDGRDMIEMDEATNKYLLRKIDWALMPIMFIAFGLQYLDKATLTYASVMGLQHDLHLKGDNYQWLASIFYLGYLSFEYPANRILQRFPIGKYCAVCIFIWGVVLACFAVTKNFAGAMAIRFMLGVMECAIVPGFTLIISQWYRKTEQGLRTCIWMSAPGLFTVIGGVLAYGIATATEKHPAKIEGWQILFLVCGVTTCTVGIVFLFVVPDNQLNARWLDQNDRILALSRIRGNQQGIGNKHFKWYQFREALTDPIVWGMVLYTLVWTITNGGISNFFTVIINSFGYTKRQSLLYATPGGALIAIITIVFGYLGDRFHNRILFSAIPLVTATIGMALIVGLPEHRYSTLKLVSYYFGNANAQVYITFISLISSNVAGYTKKTTVAAMYSIAYGVGNLIGPQTFRPQDAPRYRSGEITVLACFGVCFLIMAFVYLALKAENRRKAKLRAEPGYEKMENQEWMDLTDRENTEFVYTL